jgi:hypothetical protein
MTPEEFQAATKELATREQLVSLQAEFRQALSHLATKEEVADLKATLTGEFYKALMDQVWRLIGLMAVEAV